MSIATAAASNQECRSLPDCCIAIDTNRLKLKDDFQQRVERFELNFYTNMSAKHEENQTPKEGLPWSWLNWYRHNDNNNNDSICALFILHYIYTPAIPSKTGSPRSGIFLK